ncbi:MAG: UDP-N-acetylglucosamine 2-epimerase [Candidatus Sumerlaeia bacterium]
MPVPVLLIVIGSRAEAYACAPLLRHIRSFPRHSLPFETRLLSSGQEATELDQALQYLDLEADAALETKKPHLADARLDSVLLEEMERAIRHHAPSAVLVAGCSATSWAVIVSAYFKQVPVIHVGAGDFPVEGHRPFPDWMHRTTISQMASLHLCADDAIADGLQEMLAGDTSDLGLSRFRGDAFETMDTIRQDASPSEYLPRHACIAAIGNPSDDVLAESLERARDMEPDPTVRKVEPESPRVVAFMRRREHHANALRPFCQAWGELAKEKPDTSFVVMHSLQSFICDALAALIPRDKNIRDISPLPHPAFVRELSRARLVVTDSIGVAREALLLKRPLLIVGAYSQTQSIQKLAEKQETPRRICPMDRQAIVDTIEAMLDEENSPETVTSLSAQNTGEKSLAAILAWWKRFDIEHIRVNS